MNLAFSISLAGALLSLFVGLLSLRLARAPGWQAQASFGRVAFTASGFAACNLLTTVGTAAPAGASLVASHVQLALACVHVAAWLSYARSHLGASIALEGRRLSAVLHAAAVATLVPGLALTGRLLPRDYAPLGASYQIAESTVAGDCVLLLLVAGLGVTLAMYLRAGQRGVSHATLHAMALLGLLVMAANDAAAAAGLLRTPFLLDVGFLAPVAAVGWSLTSRIAEDARRLDALHENLEAEVARRTADLTRTEAALQRSEKLAALGQFAAGVAHEVNNPAAVVAANLRYLADGVGAGSPPPDAAEALAESLSSMERIARIVRQLLDAGRLAARPVPVEPTPLADVVRDAMTIARARHGERIRVETELPAHLHALADEAMLVQVLVNLLVNAAQAIPEGRSDGRVRILGERGRGRARLVVQDNGTGMPPEILRRVFEPFFSTKPSGAGTGLGLAVSRGLIASLGGELRIESEEGVGTRAVVELAEAPVPISRARAREARPVSAASRRVLVVDDEPAMRSALRRLLSAHYAVSVAAGVEEGLAALARETFDLVLCDVVMPDGGGARLHQELSRRAPAQAGRLVFITGGATTEEARRFLGGQPQPVLAKPFGLRELAEAAAHLDPGAPVRPACPAPGPPP